MKSPPIKFDVPYPACPKPRPRFVKDGWAHMPPKYVQWKRESAPILVSQARAQKLKLPLDGIYRIEVLLVGTSRRGDIDNWCGSVFDVLVQSGILQDDNLGILPELTAKWKRGFPECSVTLTPLE